MPATINANRVVDTLQCVDMRLKGMDFLLQDIDSLVARLLRVSDDDMKVDIILRMAQELEIYYFMTGEMLMLAKNEAETMISELADKSAA